MKKKKRHQAVPAVFAILTRIDGSILVARRSNTGYQDGNYQVPTGHIEKGEIPSMALIRECEEEIGVTPTEYKLVYVQFCSGQYLGGDRIDFFFHVTEWKGEIRNMEPNKCDRLRFVKKLPRNTSPHVRHAIECFLKGTPASELDRDFLKHPLYQKK